MTYAHAHKIFTNIDSKDYSEKEKAEAIYIILDMETHMSITKQQMLEVTKYLWNCLYEIE